MSRASTARACTERGVADRVLPLHEPRRRAFRDTLYEFICDKNEKATQHMGPKIG